MGFGGLSGMILLVEEDPLPALVRLSILNKRFSDVRRVANAAEALCVIEETLFTHNLSLVIASHHLPDLEGPVFVAELRSRVPGVPVLVLGNSQDSAREYAGSDVRFLAKPIAADEMVRLAAQMIDWAAHKAA
jgi:DNA-binding NtrC family response regulator